MASKRISFSVDPETYQKIKEKAKFEGLTISQYAKRTVVISTRSGFAGENAPNVLSDSRVQDPFSVLPYLTDIRSKGQEHMVVLSLNNAHQVIAKRIITIGLVNRTQIHPREVFTDVIVDKAAAIILAHNHPSGQVTPSREDLTATKRIKEAGELLGIPLLDHVIVSSLRFQSIREWEPSLFDKSN